jgi:hypothetical protein
MAKTRWCTIAAAAVATVALPVLTSGQGYSRGPSPSEAVVKVARTNGSTPRMPDGHPDLTGNYNGPVIPGSKSDVRCFECIETDQAILGRAEVNRPIYKPEYWQKVADLDFGPVDGDPMYNCQPLGVPRMGAPQKILQSAKEIALFNFFGSRTRFVPLDGRARDPLDAELETYEGIPLGHWEGDTLVIESVGFNDLSWLGWMGYIHSNNMKVTERLWRNGDLLYYQATVDDPQMLQQPWIQDVQVRRANPDPVGGAGEFPPCRLEEQDKEHLVDKSYRG